MVGLTGLGPMICDRHIAMRGRGQLQPAAPPVGTTVFTVTIPALLLVSTYRISVLLLVRSGHVIIEVQADAGRAADNV